MSADLVVTRHGAGASGGPRAVRGGTRLLPLVILVWLTTGANYVGFALAVETMPPFLMSGARLLVAGVVVLVGLALLSSHRIVPPTARQWRNVAIMATLLVVVGQGAVVWSVQTLDAGVAAIITASMPAWVALAGVLFLSERPPTLVLAGIATGFAGLAILAWSDGFGGDVTPVPMLVTLAGTMAGALAVVFGRRADLPDDVVPAAAMQLVIAGLAFFVVAALTGEFARFEFGAVSLRSWIGWIALLVLGGVVGHHTLVWTTRHAPPALAATFAYVGPIVGLFLAIPILGEELTAGKLVAAALTLLGAMFMVRGTAR